MVPLDLIFVVVGLAALAAAISYTLWQDRER
jgi:hypothetical protein